jgi:hypothetical protein
VPVGISFAVAVQASVKLLFALDFISPVSKAAMLCEVYLKDGIFFHRVESNSAWFF